MENSKRRRRKMGEEKVKALFSFKSHDWKTWVFNFIFDPSAIFPGMSTAELYTQKCLTPHLYLTNCDLVMVRKPSNTTVWLTVLIQYCLWQYFILIQQSRKMCLKCWLNKAWKYVQNEAIFVSSYFKISLSGVILNGSESLFFLM